MVTRSRSALRGARVALSVALLAATVVHLVLAGLADGAEVGTLVGVSIVYGVLTVAVSVGERWGYFASMGFPVIGIVLSDHRLPEPGAGVVGILIFGLNVIVLVLGALLWWAARAADSHHD